MKWLFVGPFLLLGLALVSLAWVLAWQSTGEVSVVGPILMTLAFVVPVAGLAGIGYRAGLVFDPARDRLSSWWGLFRPWFYRHAALASFEYPDVRIVRGRRGPIEYLDLRFKSGRTWVFGSVDSPPKELAAQIRTYLGKHRDR